ncbi:MAG: acetate kinase [Parachlamydia sp.]|nr:MAG: acetate kinase [Parachlamydia sp.]
MYILVLNVGSSSVKAALFKGDKEHPHAFLKPLWKGALSKHDKNTLRSKINVQDKVEERVLEVSTLTEGLIPLLESIWKGKLALLTDPSQINRIGHRIVHGGEIFVQPTVITPYVKNCLKELSSMAPLHNPPGLLGIEAAEGLFPASLQIAVFDTAFHQTMNEVAFTYPGPYEWKEKGIRRYGFHGISHAYCAKKALEILPPIASASKMICCHLGNGCSLTAIHEGKSVMNSMGFTPLEGLMMGTRCGSIDPGILLYLMRHEKVDVDALDGILNRESGLKGISEESSDMQWIIAQKETMYRAKLAFDLFVQSLKMHIGAMSALLEGLDVLIFTAGIGENAQEVRAETCKGLSYLGVHLDMEANHRCIPDQDISKKNSSVRILVIHTQEEMAIAHACLSIRD